MKTKIKKILCSILASAMMVSVLSSVPVLSSSAKESVGNGLILSTDSITLTEGASDRKSVV